MSAQKPCRIDGLLLTPETLASVRLSAPVRDYAAPRLCTLLRDRSERNVKRLQDWYGINKVFHRYCSGTRYRLFSGVLSVVAVHSMQHRMDQSAVLEQK